MDNLTEREQRICRLAYYRAVREAVKWMREEFFDYDNDVRSFSYASVDDMVYDFVADMKLKPQGHGRQV